MNYFVKLETSRKDFEEINTPDVRVSGLREAIELSAFIVGILDELHIEVLDFDFVCEFEDGYCYSRIHIPNHMPSIYTATGDITGFMAILGLVQ